ncbi:MAG TPA: hypothetical protein PKD18_11055 [Saprospiraceae bacterium]|nr:hypothetical protein [Saprospiraceae bacterium]
MKYIQLIILLFFLNSCETSLNSEADDISVRIQNSSQFDFDNIKVLVGEGLTDFGSVKANNMSNYVDLEYGYKSISIYITVNGIEYSEESIDRIIKLERGKYTIVTFIDSLHNIDFTFNKDN